MIMFGFWSITPTTMENQMDAEVANYMEAVLIWGLAAIIANCAAHSLQYCVLGTF